MRLIDSDKVVEQLNIEKTIIIEVLANVNPDDELKKAYLEGKYAELCKAIGIVKGGVRDERS